MMWLSRWILPALLLGFLLSACSGSARRPVSRKAAGRIKNVEDKIAEAQTRLDAGNAAGCLASLKQAESLRKKIGSISRTNPLRKKLPGLKSKIASLKKAAQLARQDQPVAIAKSTQPKKLPDRKRKTGNSNGAARQDQPVAIAKSTQPERRAIGDALRNGIFASPAEDRWLKARETAIKTGDFAPYFGKLSAWLNQKVPAAPDRITRKTMKALLGDRAFVGALAERHFIAKVWGPEKGVRNLGAFAKADPKNKAFLVWVMAHGRLMDEVMLTRTPTAMFARIDDSHSLDAKVLNNWKQIYYAYPESRKGLYLKLAIATALRPPGTGNRGAGMAKTPSDTLSRYAHFLKAHKNKELLPSFDTLSTWELTHVVSSGASNEDLAWGRKMINTFKPELKKGENVVSMTSQVKYEGSQIPYNDFSCVVAGGGKCGPRSSFAVFINQSFGIPAIGVGQPGHAAVSWRGTDGTWKIGYGKGWNVSKLFDRYKMSGHEFLERTEERRKTTFAKIEHLRWLAAALEVPAGSYLPPADRKYANARANAVMAVAQKIAKRNKDVIDSIPLDSKPDSTSSLASFEAPTDVADKYGARMRGFVYPPASGNYVFRIAGDDEADLFLSTDADPENKEFIAHLRAWTAPRQFDKSPTQTSKPVRLVRGKRYYIEAIHKENEGGDNLSVAWSGPGALRGVIEGKHLSPYPSGAKGKITREVWRERNRPAPAAAQTVTKPEPPIKVAPGVIHLEAEDFFARGGVSSFGGQHPSVPVLDCHEGGKQLHFQALMGDAHVGYKIDVPATGTYELTARVATVNWGQNLYVRAFGSMPRAKTAKASAVFHGMVKDLGGQKVIDNHPGTRWAVNEGVDKAWVELDMGKRIRISTVMIDERTWNRVSKYQVEYKAGNVWKKIFEGKNIGIGFSKKFPPVRAQYIRLNILDCRDNGGPTVWSFDVGTVQDGHGWINIPWTKGLWHTTKPLDIKLSKGSHTIWMFAPYQRGISLRWFELKPKATRR